MEIIKNYINQYKLNQYFNFKSRTIFTVDEKKKLKAIIKDIDSIIMMIEEDSNIIKTFDIDESLKLISRYPDKTIEITNFIKTKLYIYKYSPFFLGSFSHKASKLYNKLWERSMNMTIANSHYKPIYVPSGVPYLVVQINKIFSDLDEFNEILYLNETTIEKIVELLGNDSRIYDILKLEKEVIEKIIDNYSDIVRFINFKSLKYKSTTTIYNYLNFVNMGKNEDGKRARAETFNKLLNSSQEILDISNISKLSDNFYKKLLSREGSYLNFCKQLLDSDNNLEYLIDLLSNINPECVEALINSCFNFDFENYNCEITNMVLHKIIHCGDDLENNSKRCKLKSEFFFGNEEEKGFLEDLKDKNINNKESLLAILKFLDGNMKPSLLEAKIKAIKSTINKDEFNDTNNLKKYLSFLDRPYYGEEITKKHMRVRSDYFKTNSISDFFDNFSSYDEKETTLMENILTKQKRKKLQNLTLDIIEMARNFDHDNFLKFMQILEQIETKELLTDLKNILNSAMNADNYEKQIILDNLFYTNKNDEVNYEISITNEINSLMDKGKEYPCKIKINNKEFNTTIKKTIN